MFTRPCSRAGDAPHARARVLLIPGIDIFLRIPAKLTGQLEGFVNVMQKGAMWQRAGTRKGELGGVGPLELAHV